MTHRTQRMQRTRRGATVLAVALSLAWAASASAADGTVGGATNRSAAPAAAAPAAPATAATQAVRDIRMSHLVGMDVRNARGENLGDIKDLVVDADSGRVQYAVVGIGGFLGLGEKLSAFPMSAFKVVSSDTPTGTTASSVTGMGRGGLHAVLNADPQRLKRAPNFDADQWPDWNDAKYRGEVDRAAGVAPSSGKAGRLVRASKLLDADVRDAKSVDIGEIEDLVVDIRNGQVRYAVIDFDQAWTPDDKLVAVPMRSLRPSGDKGELRFAGDRAQIERAPAFDKSRWPDLNESRFRTDMDRYLSSWSTGATPGTGMTSAPTDRSRGSTASGAPDSGASGTTTR